MSKFKPTPAQERAINDRQKNILVSASAGSGKTAVLVDRVIKLLKENRDLNIDEMLLVTFTKEAARNMRERIRQRLIKDPDQHMKAQINRLALANISTIHSFCEQLIKRYYYVIGLDPQYRLVTDQTEQSLLKEQVWNDLQEAYFQADYQKADPSQWWFSQLAENFADPKSNVGEGLQDVVEKLSQEAGAQPDPASWLDSLVINYQIDTKEITKSAFYQKQVLPVVNRELTQIIADYQELTTRALEGDFTDVADLLVEDRQYLTQLQDALKQATWDEIRERISSKHLGKLKRHTFKDAPERKEFYTDLTKNGRNVLKKRLDDLQKKYFEYDNQKLMHLTKSAKQVVENLILVTKKYREQYQQAKLDRHLLDFNDLEHYAFQILTSKSPEGKQVLAELQQNYREILVDEYQDTNQLQDQLLSSLYNSTYNHLFMVGDVKQSIYRFRQADPTLFLDKYHQYQKPTAKDETIILAENFRSARNITDFTNLIFTQIMDRQVGEMDYDEKAQLKFSAPQYQNISTVSPEVMIYDANANNDQIPSQEDNYQRFIKLPEGSDKYVGEVWMIGLRIRQMLDYQEKIYDTNLGRMRPITPGDIVILERTKSPNNRIIDEFSRLNIPVVVQDVQNYFKATEVRTMVSLLKVIDNPYQDIPLVAVLRSPIVGLTEPEMALLRIKNRQGNFYEAIQTFLESQDDQTTEYGVNTKKLHVKLSKFMANLNEFKVTAQQESLVDVIWQIYETTGYLDYVGGMPGGSQRQANLHALYERARSYEKSSFKGLYQFIHFIEKMQQRDQDLGEAPVKLVSDAVNVMTIHGSKGLQFPVVFVIDLNHHFNSADTKDNVVVEPHHGVGIRYVGNLHADNQTNVGAPIHITYDLPQRTVISDAVTKANRAEEMRLLYVALTRAEQRLILTGSVNEKNHQNSLVAVGKRWGKALQGDKQVLGSQLRLDAKSMLDWIGMSLIRTAQFPFKLFNLESRQANFTDNLSHADYSLSVWTANDVENGLKALQQQNKESSIQDEGSSPLTRDEKQFIHNVLTLDYPYQAATRTTAYQSVSAVRDIFINQDPDDVEMGRLTFNKSEIKDEGQYIKGTFNRPQFVKKEQEKARPTDIGTATHLVFQMLNLNKGHVDITQVQRTIAKLGKQKLIANDQIAKHIDVQGIVEFYQTPLGQQILQDPQSLVREKPFSMLIDGHQLFKQLDKDDGQILIHGIIDGYLETAQGLELFDYKTDYIKSAEDKSRIDEIVNQYQGQVNLYATALQQMTGKKVNNRYLYLVRIGQLVRLS